MPGIPRRVRPSATPFYPPHMETSAAVSWRRRSLARHGAAGGACMESGRRLRRCDKRRPCEPVRGHPVGEGPAEAPVAIVSESFERPVDKTLSREPERLGPPERYVDVFNRFADGFERPIEGSRFVGVRVDGRSGPAVNRNPSATRSRTHHRRSADFFGTGNRGARLADPSVALRLGSFSP